MWEPTLGSSGRNSRFVSPPPCIVGCRARGFWRDCISASPTHLDVALFSFAEVKAAAQLTFMFFSEETVVPHVVIGPVSL